MIITSNVNSLLKRSEFIREKIEWQENLDKSKTTFLEEEHLYTKYLDYKNQQKRLSFPPPYEHPPTYQEAIYENIDKDKINESNLQIHDENELELDKINKLYDKFRTDNRNNSSRIIRNEINIRPTIMPPEYIKMPIRPLPPVSYTISRSFSSYANLREKQIKRESSKSTLMLKRQSVQFGKTFEQIRDMIRYMLSIGIRTSVIKIMGSEIADPFQTNSQLPRQVFPFSEKIDVPGFYNSKFTFTFYDYSHILFRELRNQNNIDCDHYVHSLAFDPDGLSLEVMLSEGKSIANFFRSTNGEFVIKSLTEAEFDFFIQILPSYMNV